MSDSDFFREGRFLDYDRFLSDGIENIEDLGAIPFWNDEERPPDPKAWRVRELMRQHLSESHQRVLEDTFFLQISVSEQAREQGCTRQAVQNKLKKAMKNFVRAMAEHGREVMDIPRHEL